MKLFSTSSELMALRNICGKDLVVSGTLLGGVDDHYFHNEFTREAYGLILDINKKSGEMPRWKTFLESPELSEKTREKLKKANPEKYRSRSEALRALEVLNEYRQLRGAYDLSEKIVTSLRKDKISVKKLLEKISEDVSKLITNRSAKNEVLVFGKGNNSTQFVKDMMTGESLDYLPTGFSTFDDENGGIGFGNLFVLGGSTGGGKSTLAAQLGYNWADMGEDVTIVPLEMSKREMTARLMANASGIDVRKILFGKMSEDEKKKYWKSYKKFVNGKKEAGGTFRVFKPDSDMTIEEIFASIYPFGSRVVLIDYISLLKGVDGDDAWQKLGAVARYCKIYAEAHNIIVVLLCQVSDEGVIRYARSIAEHANYAWKFVATAATREHEIINIEQLKARNGRMFDFTLRAKMDVMQIRDLELEEREELQSKSTTKKDGKGKGKKFKSKDDKDKEDKGPAKSKPSPDYLKDLSQDEDEE
jgi:archaellum biogenesis ATPase FlaH